MKEAAGEEEEEEEDAWQLGLQRPEQQKVEVRVPGVDVFAWV